MPILAPRAIDTTENFLLLTDMSAEDNQNRVQRVRHLGAGGWEDGPTAAGLFIWHPQEVIVDAAGRIYVADRDNRRIVRMDDIAGAGLTTLGTKRRPVARLRGELGSAPRFGKRSSSPAIEV